MISLLEIITSLVPGIRSDLTYEECKLLDLVRQEQLNHGQLYQFFDGDLFKVKYYFDPVSFEKGSEDSFKEIYERCIWDVYWYAYRIIGDADEAWDIATETLLKLWKFFPQFDTYQHVLSFVYYVARRLCIDCLRRRKVQYRYKKEQSYIMEQSEVPLYVQDDSSTEIIEKIYNKIESLPGQRGQVAKMAYLEEKSISEIADIMGISIQTVKNHKVAAKKMIRSEILTDKK